MDRDGTVCEEVGYLDRPERLRLLPHSGTAIRMARQAAFRTVVVTNQSGVARERFDESALNAAHARLADLLGQAGAMLDGVYYCPHHPQAGSQPYRGACECRKPEPGMLLQAARDLGLDLARSYMVGDRISDLEAGGRAGATSILVLTGYGRAEFEYHAGRWLSAPAYVARDLLEAVEWILERASASRPRSAPPG